MSESYKIEKEGYNFYPYVFREKTKELLDALIKHRYENTELEIFRLAQVESSKQIIELKEKVESLKLTHESIMQTLWELLHENQGSVKANNDDWMDVVSVEIIEKCFRDLGFTPTGL